MPEIADEPRLFRRRRCRRGSRCGWRTSWRRWRDESLGDRSQSLIFFTRLFDHPTGNQVLEFFVSTEPKHFFATTRGVPSLQPLVNDVKELFELERRAFSREGSNEFFSDKVRESTRESTFSLHSGRARIAPFGEKSASFSSPPCLAEHLQQFSPGGGPRHPPGPGGSLQPRTTVRVR